MCALFAATYPERTAALVMIGGLRRSAVWAPDYPWARRRSSDEPSSKMSARLGRAVGLEARAPSLVDDERFRDWWATYLRLSASPGAASP